MTVSFLPQAEVEHLQQVAWYEAQQPGLGARYLAEITAALESIRIEPQRFPIARAPGLRVNWGQIKISTIQNLPTSEHNFKCWGNWGKSGKIGVRSQFLHVAVAAKALKMSRTTMCRRLAATD